MNESFKIINGDNRIELDKLEANSIDSCVTDAPYELGFMNKGWDKSGIAYDVEMWKKLYRILKPGAYLLCFGGTRTYHRIACAIEDAGFEIKNTIMWLFGSGMPKGENISKAIESQLKYGKAGTVSKRQIEQECDGKEYSIKAPNNGIFGEMKEWTRKEYKPTEELAKKWQGWNTQLKPSYEPIIMAQKPVEGSITSNIIKYGVGAINIDECRVGNDLINGGTMPKMNGGEKGVCNFNTIGAERIECPNHIGRYPANVIHDGSEEAIKDMPNSDGAGGSTSNVKVTGYDNKIGNGTNEYKGGERTIFDSGSGSVSRYFYCAKASSKDRDEGLELGFEQKKMYDEDHKFGYGNNNDDNFGDRIDNVKRYNTHITVKPCLLMQYLVRLVTPKGGTVIDVFNGSGSTGKAVAFENRERNANYKYIGIELNKEYCDISIARINYAIDTYTYERKLDAKKTGLEQLDLLDFI